MAVKLMAVKEKKTTKIGKVGSALLQLHVSKPSVVISSFLLHNILCVGNTGYYPFNICFELLLFCINLFLTCPCALERKSTSWWEE